ncbi:MAG: tRNA pseudouridine(55) synthase TruB [Candidatus Izemoplasmatales bacterium]
MDGILLINKPKDMTSHDVVNIARKSLGTKKIGHTGTLDPDATGVLVLVVGKATKLVKYFSNDKKTYQCKFLIGKAYDTDDITGNIINEEDTSSIKLEEVKDKLYSFLGKQKQIPPNYSAVKVDGNKLYELARKNKMVRNITPRDVEVFKIENVEINREGINIAVEATMEVSKGTYIRSIARDLGEKLQNYGCLAELNRTKVNEIDINDCFTIDQLKSGVYSLKDPFELLNLPSIKVDSYIESLINNGRYLDVELFKNKEDTIICGKDNTPLAIYYFDETKNVMRMSVKWI